MDGQYEKIIPTADETAALGKYEISLDARNKLEKIYSRFIQPNAQFGRCKIKGDDYSNLITDEVVKILRAKPYGYDVKCQIEGDYESGENTCLIIWDYYSDFTRKIKTP
jgi:hypothetical protein